MLTRRQVSSARGPMKLGQVFQHRAQVGLIALWGVQQWAPTLNPDFMSWAPHSKFGPPQDVAFAGSAP